MKNSEDKPSKEKITIDDGSVMGARIKVSEYNKQFDKPSKGAEEDTNPDFDYEYDKMTDAQKILTDYSDGHYTQFPGWENILLAMEQYRNEGLRETLIKFLEWYRGDGGKSTFQQEYKYSVDEYLKSKQ
jgi:hypothetical protein